MPEFSIITPVYNGAIYLEQTINSVLEQDFGDFEFILIDDGSTDSSLDIIKNYAQKDNRIKYFSKENEGQGIARNFALKKAKGNYILYLDSDDWLNPGALGLLEEKFSFFGPDIILFNAYKYYEKTKNKNEFYFCEKYLKTFGLKPFSPHQAENFLLEYTSGLAFRAYKREFLIKNNITYSAERFIEDSQFYIKAMLCADKILCMDNFLVNYRIHKNSTTYRENKRIDVIEKTFYACEKILAESGFKNSEKMRYSFLQNRIAQIFYYFDIINDKDKKKYYNMMKRVFSYIEKKYHLDCAEKNSQFVKLGQIIKYPYIIYLIRKKITLLKSLMGCYFEI